MVLRSAGWISVIAVGIAYALVVIAVLISVPSAAAMPASMSESRGFVLAAALPLVGALVAVLTAVATGIAGLVRPDPRTPLFAPVLGLVLSAAWIVLFGVGAAVTWSQIPPR